MRVVKILGIVFGLFLIATAHSYFFGGMYGGWHYQRKRAEIWANDTLGKYFRQQTDVFKRVGKFDPLLHKSEEFSSVGAVQIGSIDDPIIQERCPDCVVSEKHFKVAAYRKVGFTYYLWVVTESGKIERSRSNAIH